MSHAERFIKKTLRQVLNEKITIQEATDRLLTEMGRGGRVLVVDENCLGLDPELASMNYTVKTLEPGLKDAEIKKRLRSRVFITRNGEHFNSPADMEKHYYGLVWLVSKGDDKRMGKKVEAALTASNFNRHLLQVVKV
jgi:hypothetical protein